MLKVRVKGFPVFYSGKRYEQDQELTIEEAHANDELFELVEELEVNPFKGVKETTLKKALTEAEVVIPEGIDREGLIELVKEHNLTI
ncbi:conjugal transfer protein [Enterococcus hulanensis]|uniref:conjugal transfer protein n=1 Tax=Enterococcus TaxID=1350 RepID=UPI000B5A2316|nr:MULTISPECIES: conjugal transfer protein [Enterococcus]MBO0413222.1 conjugal transfer protein [Enterococcus hulanensis]OTO15111.1 hypothetical protein A5875_004268 [Enterococcus sp. 3H8_DIV0648]